MKLSPWKLIAVVTLACTGFPATVPAQNKSNGEMLLDVSRSMSSNDRENLRWDGMLTLVELLALSEDNGLGVRHFTERDEVQIAHQRVDHQTSAIFASLARSHVRSGGGTDLVPALRNAVKELAKQPGTRFLVVVSDGEFGNDAEITALAQQFVRAGGRLFFVCLSPRGLAGANAALRSACTASGGANYAILTRPAPRKEDVLAVFLDIFLRISPPTLALLSDADGRFALHRSHRSFIALDPRGTKVQIVDPAGRTVSSAQTEPFRAREASFRKWNVFLCERPARKAVDTHWESRTWRVVSQADGLPVRDAHIYVQGDVTLENLPTAGFVARSTSDARIEVTLRASSLAEWSNVANEAGFLKDAQADARVVNAANQVVARTRLEYQPGGKFVGTVLERPAVGAYAMEIDVRHPAYPEGLLARAVGIPLRITQPFAEAELWIRSPGAPAPERVRYDPATRQQMTEVPMGAQMQVRLKARKSLPDLNAGQLRETPSIRSAVLKVQFPNGRESEQPLALDRSNALEQWVNDPWIDLSEFGLLRGRIQLEGEVRAEDPAKIGTGLDPIRIDRLQDTVLLPPLNVRGGQIEVQWGANSPTDFGCDQLLYFAGRVEIKDTPDRQRTLAAGLKKDGLVLELRGPGTAFNTRENAELFEDFRVGDTPSAITFSGFFAGRLRPGEYTLEPRLSLAGKPVIPVNAGRVITVGESAFDLALVQFTSSVTNRMPLRTCDAEAKPEPVFAERNLVAELALARPSPDLKLNQVPAFMELVSGEQRQRLELDANATSVRSQPVRLSEGRHELKIELRLGSTNIVRRAVLLDAMPAPPAARPKLVAEWNRPLEAFGSDQVLRWSGRFRIQAEPEQAALIRQALVTRGVHYEVETGGQRSDSRNQAGLFQLQPCVEDGQAIAFSGGFFGPKSQGLCSVRIVLPGGSGPDVDLENEAQELSVGENLLDLRLWAGRGDQPRRQVSLTATGSNLPAVFSDESLSIEVKPADQYALGGLTGYESHPQIEIVPSDVQPQLTMAVNGMNASTKSFSLPVGHYELRLDARITGDTYVRQRLPFDVLESAQATVAWTTQPKPHYWRYENASIGGRVSFAAGQPQDWAEWMKGRELVAVLRKPGQNGSSVIVPFGNIVQHGMSGSIRFPTDTLGEHELLLELREGGRPMAATPPMRCNVMPLIEFNVTQGDRAVLDTREGRLRILEPEQESLVTIRAQDNARAISDAKVVVRRNGTLVAEAGLIGPNGLQPVRLPALEAGTYDIEFAARVTPPGVSDEAVWLRHSVPAQCAVDVPRRVRAWIAQFGLPVLGSLAALLLGVWWFWPGLREWRTPVARRLPLLTGTLRWIPLPGLATPGHSSRTVALTGHTPLLHRLIHRGQTKRALTLGKGGDYALVSSAARLGWDQARVTLQIVGEPQSPALAITYQRDHPGGHLLVKRDAGVPLTERDRVALDHRPRMDLTIAKDIHTIMKVQINIAPAGARATAAVPPIAPALSGTGARAAAAVHR